MLQGINSDPFIAALREKERRRPSDFWSFKKPTQRTGAHALLHYPAMMVPSLQGLVMDCVQQSNPNTKRVLDPFVGSGTVLVEAMERGLAFRGIDINPLSGLACLAKSGPYAAGTFKDSTLALLSAISCDKRSIPPRDFPGRDKWLAANVSNYLEKAAAHIRLQPHRWLRRLFWLALCRVVRQTCRSRKSTYKLHIQAEKESAAPRDPHTVFIETLEHFHEHIEHQELRLSQRNLLTRGRYTQAVEIQVGDNQDLLAADESPTSDGFDLVMTSPPYGDNVTTIPYGQFSYLPLQWVDLEDIDVTLDKVTSLNNTHSTDAASLGGTLRHSDLKAQYLRDGYDSARRYLRKLQGEANGSSRFASFFFDLEQSVDHTVKLTNSNGLHAWTIANRRICGQEVPMVEVMAEMLEARAMKVIGTISRGIHFKKMAHRNSLAATMTSETILLARKAASQ